MQLEDCIRDGTYNGSDWGGEKESKVKGKSGPLRMEAELNLAYVLLFLWLKDLLEDKM